MNLNAKYRPKTLSTLIGQENVCNVLNEQIKNHDVRQCMLFVGPAGTGKTTVARITANVLNVEIFELDAASNNGVDDVRQMQEEAFKKSMLAQGKCFIIDECHSLTSQAWQALLKIVEEPPVNVYFIFCTTECQKIPETILSRVQRFDFKKVPEYKITTHLLYISEQEGDNRLNRSIMEYISRKSDGCVRQAISYLEKCLSISSDTITVDNVKDVIGDIDDKLINDFVEAIVYGNNAKKALEIVDILRESGTSYKLFFNKCFSMTLDDYIANFDTSSYEMSAGIEWILSIREHLITEDMPYEYIQSCIIQRFNGDKND